jgi:hypothetical protein
VDSIPTPGPLRSPVSELDPIQFVQLIEDDSTVLIG